MEEVREKGIRLETIETIVRQIAALAEGGWREGGKRHRHDGPRFRTPSRPGCRARPGRARSAKGKVPCLRPALRTR